jgi:hypothetical protein
MGERAAQARLATGGDHIDFVVTLVAANGETAGRLERQTQSGTVAIRELRDADCGHVADALALSLALALDPAQAVPAESAVSTPASAPEPAPAIPPGAPRPTPPPALQTTETRSLWAGLQGGAVTGITPNLLPRAGAFVEAADLVAANVALRFGVVGALGSSSTSVGAVRQWIFTTRSEGCPWRWHGPRWGLSPCVAFEFGATGASDTRATGHHDTATWAAPGADLRLDLELVPRLRFEADAGALLPLVKSQVYAGSERIYQAKFAAFHADLGVAVRLW